MEAKHTFDTPRWMGLDEIHLGGKPRGVVTNVEQNCLVNMLVNRNKSTVGGYISEKLDLPKIEIVTMDMWNPYRDVAKDLLPKAMVVVDKFHVVRMANAALESVRRGVRKGLAKPKCIQLKNDRFLLLKRFNTLNETQRETVEAWSKAFPEIGSAWVAKESYFDIWDCRDAKEAQECYAIWLAHLTPPATEAFAPLTTAMANWRTEIFRYFETRATNAYTESLNSVIRMVDRAGRGYSFEVLRAKMVFAHGKLKQEQRRVNRVRPSFDFPGGAGFQVEWPEFETVEYGVSLSVLAQLIEQGEI
jgi:transposase